MTKITLDKKTFEALAVDSRINILKALKKRRKTQAELSKELKLSAPTISEHLNKIMKAGLIKKKKQGKKWIYYELTEKGKNIIEPKVTTAFVFALSLSIVLMFIGAYSLVFMQAPIETGEFKTTQNLTSNYNNSTEITTGIEGIQQEDLTETSTGIAGIQQDNLTENTTSYEKGKILQTANVEIKTLNKKIPIILIIIGLILFIISLKTKKNSF